MKLWRAVHPTLQTHPNVWGWHIVHIPVLRFCLEPFGAVLSDENIHPRRPFAMRLEVNFEAKSLLVNLSGSAGGDLGFAHEALPLVTENKSIALHSSIEFACAIEFFVFHPKQIGKISIRF